MTDIVERLRDERDNWYMRALKAEAEIERLRAALAEIARVGDQTRIGGGQHCAALARKALERK